MTPEHKKLCERLEAEASKLSDSLIAQLLVGLLDETITAIRKLSEDNERLQEALEEIFQWYNAKDGHLVSHYPSTQQGMRRIEAALVSAKR